MLKTENIEKCLIAVETLCVKYKDFNAETLNLMAARARGELEALEEMEACAAAFQVIAPKALVLASAFSSAITFCTCNDPQCKTDALIREAVKFILNSIQIVEKRRGY